MEDLPLNDISYAQPYIDWNVLALHSGGVIPRSGQGVYEDELFRKHYENSLKVNLLRGIFHFHQPNQLGTSQVKAFLEIYNSLSWKPKKCYLDIEDISYNIYNSDGTIKQNVKILPPSKEFHTLALMQWCDEYFKNTGNSLGFYTRADYWNTWVIPSNTDFYYGGVKYTTPDWSKHSLWIASWYNYQLGDPRLPRDWQTWDIHQYEGGTGRTEGILNYYGALGPVDQNRFNGTHEEMIAFFEGKEIPSKMALIYNTKVSMKDRAKIVEILPTQKPIVAFDQLGADGIILKMGGMDRWDGSHWLSYSEPTFPVRCEIYSQSVPVLGKFDLFPGAWLAEQHTAPELNNWSFRDNFILRELLKGWMIYSGDWGSWSWDALQAKRGKFRKVSAIILSMVQTDGYPSGTTIDGGWQARILSTMLKHLKFMMDGGMIPTVPIIEYSGPWFNALYNKPGSEFETMLNNWKTTMYMQLGQWTLGSTGTFNTLNEIFAFVPPDTFKFDNYPDGYFDRILAHEFSGESQKVRTIVDANGNPTSINLSLWCDTKDEMYKFLNYTTGSIVEPPPVEPPVEPPVIPPVNTDLELRVKALEDKIVDLSGKIVTFDTKYNELAQKIIDLETKVNPIITDAVSTKTIVVKMDEYLKSIPQYK